MKLELVLTKELFQSGCELAAEDAAECAGRKEEASGRRKPSGAIGSETAGRNNVMYVWMMPKVLSPSVEHAKKPDVCTQVLGVAGQFEQRRCTGSEQKMTDESPGPFGFLIVPVQERCPKRRLIASKPFAGVLAGWAPIVVSTPVAQPWQSRAQLW